MAEPIAAASPSFRPSYTNVLGCVVFDDNLRLVSDFLYGHCMTPDIEIEGKLGLLFWKKRDIRVHIDGVRGLVALAADEIDAAFAAEVDLQMFKHINEQLLQRRYTEDQQKSTQTGSKPLWSFQHHVTIDKFHTVGNDHVRVSYDQEGKVLECIVKEKIQHLDFWNGKPKCIDFRLSASKERRVELPKNDPEYLRKKDRLSYRFDMFAIELTKVDQFHTLVKGEPTTERPSSTTFEVEVEIKEMAFLRQEAQKVKQGQPNEFVKISTALLETLRTLAQYALPPHLPPGWKPIAPPTGAAATPVTQPKQQGTKRPREEDEKPKEEFGRVWS